MVDDRTDPSEQIPEADLLEQQTPLDALTDTAPDWPQRPDGDVELGAIDDADRLEQLTALPGDDADDYPHQPPGGQSS